MNDPDDELLAVADELEAVARELRRDLTASRARPEPSRSSVSDEAFRSADEAAIPVLITLLQLNVRTLEAIQRAIRPKAHSQQERTETREIAVVSDQTLDRFDDAIVELQRAIAERSGSDPARDVSDPARGVLDEARELREELDRRIQEASEAVARASRRDCSPEPDNDDSGVEVDVDAELESIKRASDEARRKDDERDGVDVSTNREPQDDDESPSDDSSS